MGSTFLEHVAAIQNQRKDIMRDFVDLHTHTIASGHAYNTINEMVQAAVNHKLEILGITEHAPAMTGTCTQMYFMNLRALPRQKMGITVCSAVSFSKTPSSLPPAILDKPFPIMLMPYRNNANPPTIFNKLKMSIQYLI